MDSPYRSQPGATPPAAPRDPGLVGEVIEQFADPMALYRELVQNAIDAGSPTIEIELSYDAGEQAARIAVRDTGEGMDRDILENRLVVLFRSSKENDPTKIGKFGIGFASVLAIRPRAVIVRTARAGARFVLHLYPDLTYELFEAGAATRSGTTVELLVPGSPDAMPELARASEQALRRWCRHASVPIAFRASGGGGVRLAEVRIDEPLAIDSALVQVDGRSDDGATAVVVGLTGHGMPYTGYFNHGLMLQETPGSLIGETLSTKIQDSRLGHTISRDSVRQDEACARAVLLARRIASERLPTVALAALRDALRAGDHARYYALFDALLRCGLNTVDRGAWPIPLIEPARGRREWTLDELRAHPPWVATRQSALTAAMARANVPVVDGRNQPTGGMSRRLNELRRSAHVDVHDELTLITPVALTGSDHALVDEVGLALRAAQARTSAVQLVTLCGAHESAPFVHGVRDDSRPVMVDRQAAGRPPFARLLSRPIALNVDHARVAAARRAADTDPAAAGGMLARLILHHYSRLDVRSSERVFHHAVNRLIGGDR